MINVWSIKEFCNTILPEPRWLVREMLPEGLTLLTGEPKIGKSWLALDLCGMVAKESQRSVLYLAINDNLGRMKARIENLDITDLENLYVTVDCPSREDIDRFCSSYDPVLIAIDPWIELRHALVGSDKKNRIDYSTIYEGIDYLKGLVKQGINILIVHYEPRINEIEHLKNQVPTILNILNMWIVDNILRLGRQWGTGFKILEVMAWCNTHKGEHSRTFRITRRRVSFKDYKWKFLKDEWKPPSFFEIDGTESLTKEEKCDK
jgi:hypothetical protein